jgi:hypothetical protein
MYMGLMMLSRQIHTAGAPVHEPGAYEFQMAIEKLNRKESPGIDKIRAEFIKAGVAKFALRSINLLILLGIERNCLRS